MPRLKFTMFLLLTTAMPYRVLYAAEDYALSEELKWLSAESIEVVSKQKEYKASAAGIVSVITHEDIERYGGGSLFEVLNRVTSIYMLGTAIYSKGSASVRGDLSDSTSAHTLVLINGRPFRDSGFGGLIDSILRSFPLHNIEQIEVVRGPGSVLYGTNAFTGVINIVTKKKQENGMTVRGRYGSFNSGQAETNFAWKNETANVTGALRYQGSDGWLFSANRKPNAPLSSFRMQEDNASADIYGQWGDVTLNGFFAHNRNRDWGPARDTEGENHQHDRIFLDLGYQTQWNSHWSSQWNLTYNHLTDGQYVPAPPDFQPTFARLTENNLLFEQTQFLNFFDKKLNIVLGGLVEWQTGVVNQVNVNNPPLPKYDHLKSSLYGEISYALLDNLKLTAGGQWHRFDHLDNKSNQPITGKVGRLGLVYEITPEWGIKALYSQAFRSAAAFELGVDALPIKGDPALQPERVETIDGQIFYHSKNYQASITGFRSRQSKFITIACSPTCFPVKYVNAGSAVYEGFEIETKAKLFDNWHWQGAYTFQTNRDGNKQNNVSLAPNHLLKLGVSYDISPDLQLSVFDAFVSKAKVLPDKKVINPAAGSYHNLSINANYRLDSLLGFAHTKHVTFSLYLDNLLNEKINYTGLVDNSFNSFPGQPGRTLFGELAIGF